MGTTEQRAAPQGRSPSSGRRERCGLCLRRAGPRRCGRRSQGGRPRGRVPLGAAVVGGIRLDRAVSLLARWQIGTPGFGRGHFVRGPEAAGAPTMASARWRHTFPWCRWSSTWRLPRPPQPRPGREIMGSRPCDGPPSAACPRSCVRRTASFALSKPSTCLRQATWTSRCCVWG